MKKLYCFILVVLVAVCFTQFSYAAEHGGKKHGGKAHGAEEHSKEHGGKEHGGAEHEGSKGSGHAEPKAQDIRQAMKNYVDRKSVV